MNSGPARVVAATALWLVTLAGAFMLFTGEWTAVDLVGAGVCGLIGSAVTIPMVRMKLFDLRFRPSWLRFVPSTLKQIVVDFGIVTWFLLSRIARADRTGGVFVARRGFPAGGEDAEGTAWRGFVSVTATLSPNSYVVDINHRSGNRLSHDLVPNRRSEQPA